MGTVTAVEMEALPIMPPTMDILVQARAPTGSRWICNPPFDKADNDWLIFVHDLDAFRTVATAEGWTGADHKPDANDYPEGWVSLRGPNSVNLIVTANPEFFNRFDAATHVAKRLNLMVKADRIALFQAVLYANKWTDPSEAPAPSHRAGETEQS